MTDVTPGEPEFGGIRTLAAAVRLTRAPDYLPFRPTTERSVRPMIRTSRPRL